MTHLFGTKNYNISIFYIAFCMVQEISKRKKMCYVWNSSNFSIYLLHKKLGVIKSVRNIMFDLCLKQSLQEINYSSDTH